MIGWPVAESAVVVDQRFAAVSAAVADQRFVAGPAAVADQRFVAGPAAVADQRFVAGPPAAADQQSAGIEHHFVAHMPKGIVADHNSEGIAVHIVECIAEGFVGHTVGRCQLVVGLSMLVVVAFAEQGGRSSGSFRDRGT